MGLNEEIAAGTIIGFDYILPVDDETCRQHIASSMARGLPDVVGRNRLTVIANGPSSRGANLREISGPTLSVNGSIGLFMDQGLAPTYWAGCDPQALLAELLPDSPPMETIYLIASKCHPSVFEKLKGRRVLIWHLADHPAEGRVRISLACSVTLSATWLMHRLGFTDFEYWGWDGCYMDGRHHAVGDEDWSDKPELCINYGGTVDGSNVIGGRTFPTTRTWAAEAKAAEQFFQLTEYFDIGVTINGDGMFACAKSALESSP